jgi:hypothetical protein
MEDALTVIATLRDMVWNARKYRSAVSRHVLNVTALPRQVAHSRSAYDRKWRGLTPSRI